MKLEEKLTPQLEKMTVEISKLDSALVKCKRITDELIRQTKETILLIDKVKPVYLVLGLSLFGL